LFFPQSRTVETTAWVLGAYHNSSTYSNTPYILIRGSKNIIPGNEKILKELMPNK
jgi:hypothetical protein